MIRAALAALSLIACRAGAPVAPTVGDAVFVVPGDALPDEIVVQPANNNLSVIRHEGSLFLAWRTGPTHFASAKVQMHVVRSDDDGASWVHETTVDLDTDVREPQLLSWGGELRLFFAVLGTNALDFEPQGTKTSLRRGPADWAPLEDAFDPTFIPWRMKVLPDGGDGEPRISLLGYTGGENVYDVDGEPIDIQWLTSDDGLAWRPYVEGTPTVQTGGGSETDLAWTRDGGIVAVIRNEAGDADGFGSKVCTAPPDALGTWTCSPDPLKYDSPLVFRQGDDVWLIGRRNVTADGRFDVADPSQPMADRYLQNQFAYWQEPKRCALWWVNPRERAVQFVLDLPSAGDTCFPDLIDNGDGTVDVFNYTSPLDGTDPTWIEGQNGDTGIYRLRLSF